MTTVQFKKWQKAMGLSNPQAALELAVTERMVTYYRSGTMPIGRQTARLCELLAAAPKAQPKP